MVPLVTTANIDPVRRRALEAEVAPLTMLQDVVRHVYGRRPPGDIVEVVVQDEFTHDVVVSWDEVYLVFDTT